MLWISQVCVAVCGAGERDKKSVCVALIEPLGTGVFSSGMVGNAGCAVPELAQFIHHFLDLRGPHIAFETHDNHMLNRWHLVFSGRNRCLSTRSRGCVD